MVEVEVELCMKTFDVFVWRDNLGSVITRTTVGQVIPANLLQVMVLETAKYWVVHLRQKESNERDCHSTYSERLTMIPSTLESSFASMMANSTPSPSTPFSSP